jgi:putative sigma-54 modulation protein
MNVQITSRHEKVSQETQDYLRDELTNLSKFYDKITSCHAILDTEHKEKKIEITLNVLGHSVIAKASADNLGKAVEEALERVKRQLKKQNEKLKQH